MASKAENDRKPDPPEASSLKVFISYSRSDLAFADELVAGLDFAGGYDVTIDRDAIHEGEDWKARLGVLIAEADTIVFILSPKSATSSICKWEVEEAARLSKRILPALALPLDGAPVPEQLAALNYVRFDEGRSFMAGLAGLRHALNTDPGWLREHTRLLTRAREWDAASRVDNRLLTGSDIADAKAWLDRHPKDAPPPTELHHDFIHASDQAEVARLSEERKRAERLQRAVKRTRVALAGALVLAIVAGGAGWWANQKQQEAEAQTKRAQASQKRAQASQKSAMKAAISAAEADLNEIEARADAEAQRDAAKRALARAQITQSRYLADLAQQHVGRHDYTTAMLLSLAGLPDGTRGMDRLALRGRPYVPEAEASLYAGYFHNRERAMLEGHTTRVTSAAFSPDGRRIVTASSDNTARLWDAVTGKAIATLEGHTKRVSSAVFSLDGRRIVTASGDKTARLWEAATGKAIATLEGHTSGVISAAFSPDGRRIVTASRDKTARLWTVFPTTQALVDHAKRTVPRCLTRAQRAKFYLPAEPPRWCITGAGLERETEPAKWQPKWPYHTAKWRDWLVAGDAGKTLVLPKE